MDDNQKKFNIYVFTSTFARNLVEEEKKNIEAS